MDPNLPKTAGHAPPDWRGLCEELVRHAEIAQSIAVGDGLWDGDDDEFPECLDRARAALAEPVAEWPTDTQLIEEAIAVGLAFQPQDKVSEVFLPFDAEEPLNELLVNFARAVLARYGHQPAPPVEGEVGELPPRPPIKGPPEHPWLVRYGVTWQGGRNEPLLTPRHDGYWTPWFVAADLLEQRHPAPVPVAEGEVGELVEWLRDRAESTSLAHNALRITRAADLLEQCAQALSEGQHYLAQYQQTRSHTLELRRVEVLPPGALPLPAGEVES